MSGIPARCVPPELQAPRRGPRQTIDLSLLRQPPPTAYRVDAGDVLGVYVEGILGRHEDVPPVNFPQDREQANALGFPIPVRDDGTISLPLIPPLVVRGYTMAEVESAIRDAYTRGVQSLLQPGQDRILVSLQKPRLYHVLVVRQEGTVQHNVTRVPSIASTGTQKRGVGMVVALPAYQNDVMHALAHTGGLPGVDAENAVYIMRRGRFPLPEMTPPQIGPGTPPPPAPPAFAPAAPAFGPVAPAVEPAMFHAPPPRDAGLELLGPPSAADILRAMDRPTIRGQSPDGLADARPPQDPWARFGPQSGYPATGRYGGRFFPAATAPSGWSTPAPVQPASTGGFSPAVAAPGHSPWQLAPFPTPLEPQASDETFAPPLPYVIDDATIRGPGVVRIPLSMQPGEPPQFSPQDVILQDGDVLFIETRQDEFFYTGGLLGGGKFTLPQDRDLDVMEAVLLAESDPIRTLPTRAIGGVSVLNQDVTVGASEVVVLRQLPDGRQAPIKVNLYDAMRHPEERVLVQPGDYLFLQYTRTESVFAFIERQLLEGAVVGYATSRLYGN